MAYKHWTNEEDQFLRDNYPTSSSAEVAEALGRSVASVVGRANKLMLKRVPKEEPWCPSGQPWTVEQEDYLRAHWHEQSDEELAAAVGHPAASTQARRLMLGLRLREGTRGPDWTAEEVELMQELWGTYTIPQIAKRLNRSEQSIKVKSTRLGLGRYVNSSVYLTANQVANLLHVDIHAVTDVWIPAGLPFKWKAPRGNRKFRHIRMDDLQEFLRNNPDRWDSRRVDLFALGEEPDWLKEKRKADMLRPVNRCQKWTPDEDARLISLFRHSGKTWAEIGAEMNRSSEACQRRITRLDAWGTGKYLGQDPWKEKREKKVAAEKKLLGIRLCNAIRAYRNSMEWGEFWQKDNCQHWDPVRGCLMQCSDCDSCTKFQRIRPQYCRMCGAEFLERREQTFCQKCRTMRKKQAQRKYAVLRARGKR